MVNFYELLLQDRDSSTNQINLCHRRAKKPLFLLHRSPEFLGGHRLSFKACKSPASPILGQLWDQCLGLFKLVWQSKWTLNLVYWNGFGNLAWLQQLGNDLTWFKDANMVEINDCKNLAVRASRNMCPEHRLLEALFRRTQFGSGLLGSAAWSLGCSYIRIHSKRTFNVSDSIIHRFKDDRKRYSTCPWRRRNPTWINRNLNCRLWICERFWKWPRMALSNRKVR